VSLAAQDAVVTLVIGFDPLLLGILASLATADLMLAWLILRNHAWANYLVALFATFLFVLACAGLGSTAEQKPGANTGGCIGILIIGALFYYSVQNLSVLWQVRAAGLKADDEPRPKYGWIVVVAALGAGAAIVGVALSMSSFFPSNIEVAEWREFAPKGMGFRADLPGVPKVEEKAQETPGGIVGLHKFSVEPKGKKELFMIVVLAFPEEFPDGLNPLELAKQDVLAAASQGTVRSERQISLAGVRGIELEVLPPKGAVVKARIYATKTRIYQLLEGVCN
jgi:hypothetical protein